MGKIEYDGVLIFLDYIKSNGFNPDNYSRILELFQSADGSLSKYLKKYRHFLLSRQVRDTEIKDLGIHGTYGFLNDGKIYIPTINDDFDTDVYNSGRIFLNKKHYVPRINYFDVIIGNSILPMSDIDYYEEIRNCLVSNILLDKYLGACIDSCDLEVTKDAEKFYSGLAEISNYMVGNDLFSFNHDTINDKELFLIKKCR